MVVEHRQEPLLQVQEVDFAYQSRPVLEGVDVAIAAGELVGIIGPNGSGKSTLLGLMAGLLPPGRGRVLLQGRPLSRYTRPQLARIMGLVPQAAELAAGFTVLETVLAGRYALMGNRYFERPQDLEAARRAIAHTGLEELIQRQAGQLSGGERQRLMLARALAAQPRLLLLDEPTSALDLKHQLMVMSLLEHLCREDEVAVGLVSHDLNLAALFCHRLVLLHRGRVLAAGRPEQVITPKLLEQAYGTRVWVDREPHRGRPRVTLVPPQPVSGQGKPGPA